MTGHMRRARRGVGAGALATAGVTLFYGLVVDFASGSWGHLTGQARKDWHYLAPILVGFGVQVELRRRHRLRQAAAAAGGAGVGSPAAGIGVNALGITLAARRLGDLPEPVEVVWDVAASDGGWS